MPPGKSLAALALAAAACRPSASNRALVVGNIVVSEAGLLGKPEIGESSENLRKELGAALEASGRFAVREGGPVRVQLEIDRAQRTLAPPAAFNPARPVAEHEVADVGVTLEMTSTSAQGEIERLVAEGMARKPTNADDSLDPAARHTAFKAALDAALADAVAALGAQLDARHKTDDELLKDLTAPDPRARDYAIRMLADRRSPAAVPQLIARLQDPTPEVARRAAGALIAIGDRRAVTPLIELTRHRRAEDVGPILYAIASLGGPEAEAFLFTLESGAPDEETRRAAKGAYEDLVRRKKDDAARLSQRRRARP
jgi:hypothetical protein